MSKHETWMTKKYARSIGGAMILEFPVLKPQKGVGGRRVDALIIGHGPHVEAHPADNVDMTGQDVIVVQTKASRLGMAVMGQAIFSIALVKRHFKPKSVKAVIVCTGHDEELEALLKPYKNVEVRVYRRKKPAA
jgi:hypothetical protein